MEQDQHIAQGLHRIAMAVAAAGFLIAAAVGADSPIISIIGLVSSLLFTAILLRSVFGTLSMNSILYELFNSDEEIRRRRSRSRKSPDTSEDLS